MCHAATGTCARGRVGGLARSWVQRKRVEGLSKGKLRNYEARPGLRRRSGISRRRLDYDEDEDPAWRRGDAIKLRRLAAATRNSGSGFSVVPQRVLAERPFSIDGRATKTRDLLVKWRGRPYDESSWERECDLDRCGTSFREAFDERERSVDTPAIKAKRQLGTTTRNKLKRTTGVVRRRNYETINCRASVVKGESAVQDRVSWPTRWASARHQSAAYSIVIYERSGGEPRARRGALSRCRTGSAN